jgi:hypothetical protein
MVPGDILFAQVSEQLSAVPDQSQQTVLRTVVMAMSCQVLSQVVYLLGKQRYLDFRGTSIVFVCSEFSDYFCLFFLVQIPPLVLPDL